MTITIHTTKPRQVLDITYKVQQCMHNGVKSALLTVLHTTCALTTADLDPGTDEDLLELLEKITPHVNWRHPHDPDHTPAHLLSSLIGPSITIPVENGNLQLGTWQRIILVELDGPRDRNISVVGL